MTFNLNKVQQAVYKSWKESSENITTLNVNFWLKKKKDNTDLMQCPT